MMDQNKNALLKLAEHIENGSIKQINKKAFIQTLNEIVADIEEIQNQFFFLDDYLRYLDQELRNLVFERIRTLEHPYQTEEWIKERTVYNSRMISLVDWHNALQRRLKQLEGN